MCDVTHSMRASRSHVQNVECVACVTHKCDTTRFICATQLVHVCDTTHQHVRHDNMCGMTYSMRAYSSHVQSVKRVASFTRMWDTTHFICATQLCHMCDTTRHDSFYACTKVSLSKYRPLSKRDLTWTQKGKMSSPQCSCDMTHSMRARRSHVQSIARFFFPNLHSAGQLPSSII